MSLTIAVLIAAAAPFNTTPAKATIKPDVSSNQRKTMNRFLAAALLKDEVTMRALAAQDVPVVPPLDSRPGLRPTTLDHVINITRSCTLGAATHGGAGLRTELVVRIY